MTEKEITLLGFEKSEVGPDQHSEPYHYYSYRVTRGMEFISCPSDESTDGKWYVEIFNTEEPIRFHEFGEVQALINKLERAKHEKN